HAYSATRQTFHSKFVNDLTDHGDLKTIWTMRNDSTYLFRWGAPDFLREFVRNLPQEVNRGYYFGSDGWIWGRDFVCKSGPQQGELEIKRHWFQWLLWGRFAYDPSLSNERLAGIVEDRFPEVEGKPLLKAWQAVSMVFPITTGFHWGPLDYHWYPEACVGIKGSRRKDGFHDVESFIKLGSHPGSDFIDIETYVKDLMKGEVRDGTSPHDASKELLENAEQALDATAGFDAGENGELAETLADMEAMAQLSRYYGHKIEGATRLHLFREMNDPKDQALAVASLERAAEAWRAYTANLLTRYQNPIWCARIRSGPVDWKELTRWVEEDVLIAREGSR
ncbi:MAG: carbohydrate-binding family 6 protein, partial [Verrucomicrobiota bacterium]